MITLTFEKVAMVRVLAAEIKRLEGLKDFAIDQRVCMQLAPTTAKPLADVAYLEMPVSAAAIRTEINARLDDLHAKLAGLGVTIEF